MLAESRELLLVPTFVKPVGDGVPRLSEPADVFAKPFVPGERFSVSPARPVVKAKAFLKADLKRRCTYLSSDDLQLIMGGNIQRIYNLT